MVLRVYVEKKPGFDIEAQKLAHELREFTGIDKLESLRLFNCYDVEGISPELFSQCVPTVFSEPQTDVVSFDLPEREDAVMFAVEALPGQFDQRASSAAECIQLISQSERPEVRNMAIYLLEGALTSEDIQAIKDYVINPVESREATLDVPETLKIDYPAPPDVEVLDGFIGLNEQELQRFIADRGLAMDLADIQFCQEYFRDIEKRDPTITEIKMIDTYWSDHCRHTTFGTQLENIKIDDERTQKAFDVYLSLRDELARANKPLCLMDMGTIGARYLKAQGTLKNLDESDEINACTIKCTVDVDGKDEDWLYLFKNETHNHPTEIEPYGGAATCVGGAIRDPLSGRSYVYQSMRVTGAADPTVPADQTIEGKLPQRKLVTTAAAGFSSYGNQIGLATGQVNELYHPGYAAKRMEIGAVVGATPADHVRREEPTAGDVIVLLGGRTGRDGIGGATGSSKAHTSSSLETCGAEVQKGNPPIERKIQRLFRRGDACRMIKRCNDFGAGGVSVAIGELADGLKIDLDAVPKKYEGLDGTELAISESQERMAVALAAEDVDAFIELAHQENLEATPVAVVTDDARVTMDWRGQTIVDVSRQFLASNGAPKHQDVHVVATDDDALPSIPGSHAFHLDDALMQLVTDINVASNKGLVERFDSTIGAATVLMPFGGKHQLTPSMAMVAKLPVFGKTTTVSGMAWGFNPYLSSADQFSGAYLAVVESIARLIAAGFERKSMYLTFQEYFEKLRTSPERWGKPMASVLGALMAQIDLGVGAIGGKDSMSGSFEELDVPPTLVSFATAIGSIDRVISPELKEADHRLILIQPTYDDRHLVPTGESLREALDVVEKLIGERYACAVSTPGFGGLGESLFKMTVGNALGVHLDMTAQEAQHMLLGEYNYGSFIMELNNGCPIPESTAHLDVIELGSTIEPYELQLRDHTIDLSGLQESWEHALESVFPYRNTDDAAGANGETLQLEQISFHIEAPHVYSGHPVAKPRVIIPVFPGNNCEYDTAAAFEHAGAIADTFIVNNLTPTAIAESTAELAKRIRESQIVMIPGGFSGGDEPDGSAKFITAFFRAPEVTEAVRDLLQNRDGLMLGICNGFQALVKLGLVPFGDIRPMDETCPTLTFNTIGRHQSLMVRTRVASDLSPWLSECEVGDIHTVAISHGEGRFVASSDMLSQMIKAGQIATQYVDANGIPSMDLSVNPNGSVCAIEGITSPDGRIFGKMGHSERSGVGLYKNIPGLENQPIFVGGVKYFQ